MDPGFAIPKGIQIATELQRILECLVQSFGREELLAPLNTVSKAANAIRSAHSAEQLKRYQSAGFSGVHTITKKSFESLWRHEHSRRMHRNAPGRDWDMVADVDWAKMCYGRLQDAEAVVVQMTEYLVVGSDSR